MNTSDLGYKFPQEEEKIINNFLLPSNKDHYYSECEFHLENEKSDKVYLTSSIPGCLDMKNKDSYDPNPTLLFFYYNKDMPIFNKWYDVVKSVSPGGTSVFDFYQSSGIDIIYQSLYPDGTAYNIEEWTDPINFKMINLDLEKNLYKTFQNLKLTNPFNWMKIKDNKKDPFVIFYLQGFPQEFYKEEVNFEKIKERYMFDDNINWRKKYYDSSSDQYKAYYEQIRKDKTRIIDDMNLKDNYFLALEDDKPVAGIKKGKYYKIISLSGEEYKFIEV